MSDRDDVAATIADVVARALDEDVGSGDLTAGLIAADAAASAKIIAREAMVLAGRPFVDRVFTSLDDAVRLAWRHDDGDLIEPGAVVCTLTGPARPLLTGERTALNLLQTLSATATATAEYVDAVAGTGCRILDTRKTLPGLRLAQKYAVRCGGGMNHRSGLFDAILIKENHIVAAGGIETAIRRARALNPGLPVEAEVETLAELRDGLAAQAERLLLDNFSHEDLRRAVELNRAEGRPPAELEASGNVTLQSVGKLAATGVDFISVGALTKNIRAIDLSMRFD